MKLTCPSCHTIFHLEAAMEEAAGREFTAFVCGLGELARPLVAYLGLFRPASRALGYERMLRLARETLELSKDTLQLATALSETVEALRQKRDEGDVRPLKNHNYLKRVLENQPPSIPPYQGGSAMDSSPCHGGSGVTGFSPDKERLGGVSKTARAIGRLENWKNS
jgi:hypothetical protein